MVFKTRADGVRGVSLAALVRQARETPQTGDGMPVLGRTKTVECDLGLVRSIPENLVRSVVEHTDTPLTVWIGALDNDDPVEGSVSRTTGKPSPGQGASVCSDTGSHRMVAPVSACQLCTVSPTHTVGSRLSGRPGGARFDAQTLAGSADTDPAGPPVVFCSVSGSRVSDGASWRYCHPDTWLQRYRGESGSRRRGGAQQDICSWIGVGQEVTRSYTETRPSPSPYESEAGMETRNIVNRPDGESRPEMANIASTTPRQLFRIRQ